MKIVQKVRQQINRSTVLSTFFVKNFFVYLMLGLCIFGYVYDYTYIVWVASMLVHALFIVTALQVQIAHKNETIPYTNGLSFSLMCCVVQRCVWVLHIFVFLNEELQVCIECWMMAKRIGNMIVEILKLNCYYKCLFRFWFLRLWH